MSPLSAYFFGLITMFVILIPFWYAATTNKTLKSLYIKSVCSQICS